jgi:hypothetical protein
MALRCRFSFLSRFNVGGKLWWRCTALAPTGRGFRSSATLEILFQPPHPSTHSFFHSVHVHALNPRREARRKYTVKKHSIITTEKKREGEMASQPSTSSATRSAAGSIHVRARQCIYYLKILPFLTQDICIFEIT